MASAISTTSIDATFPVAGQDNDSQGFRDNFSQIKTQLDTASSEITTIQTNQAVTNATTNFNGHDIQNAILIDFIPDFTNISASTCLVVPTGTVDRKITRVSSLID